MSNEVLFETTTDETKLARKEKRSETILTEVCTSISQVLKKYPADEYNLVLPLRAPKTPENYELWVTGFKLDVTDCARIGGNLMPLKHAVLRIAREAGVIVEEIKQILPSTWKNLVLLLQELQQHPPNNLSIEYVRSMLERIPQEIIQRRLNDVAVQVTVLMEVAPGEYVRGIGTAEWIEEDERKLIERKVRRSAEDKNLSDEEIQQLVEESLVDVRRFRLRIAETKALLRAMRAILALKTSYTPAEISRPFVVVSWRRKLSPEELEERWRWVFGDFENESRRETKKIVEVREGDGEEITTETEIMEGDEDGL